jgi:hypothetical protein
LCIIYFVRLHKIFLSFHFLMMRVGFHKNILLGQRVT